MQKRPRKKPKLDVPADATHTDDGSSGSSGGNWQNMDANLWALILSFDKHMHLPCVSKRMRLIANTNPGAWAMDKWTKRSDGEVYLGSQLYSGAALGQFKFPGKRNIVLDTDFVLLRELVGMVSGSQRPAVRKVTLFIDNASKYAWIDFITKTCPNLTSLHVKSNLTCGSHHGQPPLDGKAFAAIARCKRLQVLSIRLIPTAWWDIGTHLSAESLPELHELTLHHVWLDTKSDKEGFAFFTSLSLCTNLARLHVSFIQSTFEHVAQLEALKLLRFLGLAGFSDHAQYCAAADISALCAGLPALTHLRLRHLLLDELPDLSRKGQIHTLDLAGCHLPNSAHRPPPCNVRKSQLPPNLAGLVLACGNVFVRDVKLASDCFRELAMRSSRLHEVALQHQLMWFPAIFSKLTRLYMNTTHDDEMVRFLACQHVYFPQLTHLAMVDAPSFNASGMMHLAKFTTLHSLAFKSATPKQWESIPQLINDLPLLSYLKLGQTSYELYSDRLREAFPLLTVDR